MMPRPFTRNLPAHHGCFSYARIPGYETTGAPAGVTYRLFRRDQRGATHYFTRVYTPEELAAKCRREAAAMRETQMELFA